MEKEIKNNEPVAMTDKGPHNTKRNKSKDGRYTANPFYKENSDPKQDALLYPVLDRRHKEITNQGKGYIENQEGDIAFDKNVAEPWFKKVINRWLLPKLEAVKEPGENTIAMEATEYEDVKLGIDFIIGNIGPENKFVIDAPNMGLIDLKTSVVKNPKHYENPSISLPIKRFQKRKGVPEPVLKKHLNNLFAFQFMLTNLKDKTQMKDIDDIQESKCYLFQKDDVENYIAKNFPYKHNSKLDINEAFDIYSWKNNQKNDDDFIKYMNEKGFDPVFYVNKYGNHIYELSIALPNTNIPAKVIFENIKGTGDKELRVSFPADEMLQYEETMVQNFGNSKYRNKKVIK